MLTHPVADMDTIAWRERTLMLACRDANGSEARAILRLNGMTQSDKTGFVADIENMGDAT